MYSNNRSREITNIISHHIEKIGVKQKIFIQINIGKEKQKSGIDKVCERILLSLFEFGIKNNWFMCIPPISDNHHIYFKEMKRIKDSISNNLLLIME